MSTPALATVLAARLLAAATASVSDALDRLRLPGSAHGIRPLAPGQRVAGPAYTLRYVPVGATPGTVGDFIDDVPPGSVIVIDNQGRTECTVWGDILTSVAHDRGIAGTVIWGTCRDTALARELGYSIYSSSCFMRTGKGRVELVETGSVVALGDVQVRPGDLVIGDDDGIVVVPRERAAEVADVAASIAEVEDAIVRDARAGMSLAEARGRHGYHRLQEPTDD